MNRKQQIRAQAVALAIERERTVFEIAKWSKSTLKHGPDEIVKTAKLFARYIETGRRPE